MKTDIKNRKDVELLVNTFYSKVKEDDVIGFFFNDVAKIDWNHHLPRMYDFWENILFFTGNYNGSPMVIHKELHQKHPMNEAHFTHWLNVFCATVDELFSGEKADCIKERATNIANVLKYKTLL